ncbi:adenine nucleotide alpha hydrolase [Pseudonocardia sp. KRD291]|uniref:adenine nucleotide alpha hydrolase n=1 Tax=Pseudonocardia sp. KRD291 TaxID=2792007 RepID=UPI001C5C1974|nr:adenine nucleotide alpha hydrolase [Pseudonocardia sp. KRD291]MBW0101356.1 adenine nucleotide alpha hydrolase [Pseudonocardia sp. KRD291]
MGTPKAWLSWSSGKDATFALHALRSAGEVEVTGLLTTVARPASGDGRSRVPVHDVAQPLVQAQADALGLALHAVELPSPCPNDAYRERTGAALQRARADGVAHVAFGDLFLADVREFREQSLRGTGVGPLFPLWGRDTAALAASMVACGLRAVVTCVDPARAPASLAGRWFDESFLDDLPDGVDPCGENGEFHTFVTDGPGFARPVPVEVVSTGERDGFVQAEIRAA